MEHTNVLASQYDVSQQCRFTFDGLTSIQVATVYFPMPSTHVEFCLGRPDFSHFSMHLGLVTSVHWIRCVRALQYKVVLDCEANGSGGSSTKFTFGKFYLPVIFSSHYTFTS